MNFRDPYLGLAAGYFAHRGGGRSPMQALGGGILAAAEGQRQAKMAEAQAKRLDQQNQEAERKLKMVQRQEKLADQVYQQTLAKYGESEASMARDLVLAGQPEQALKVAYSGGMPEKAPTTRRIYQGTTAVDQEWDSGARAWKVVGRGPRTTGAETWSFDPESGRFLMVKGPAGMVSQAPLGKKAEGAVQENWIRSADSLSRMAEIRRSYNPEFLTYMGAARKEGLSFIDKISRLPEGESKQYLKDYRTFQQGVKREFNAYRKYVTGAAAAMAELEDLKDAIINMDLSPAEFEAAMDQYEGELKRAKRLSNKLMREGLSLDTKAYGSQFEQEWLAGMDDGLEQRGPEVEQHFASQGLEGEELIQAVDKVLHSEGYI